MEFADRPLAIILGIVIVVLLAFYAWLTSGMIQWLISRSRSFSLRELLITVTLFAVVLGLVIYAVK